MFEDIVGERSKKVSKKKLVIDKAKRRKGAGSGTTGLSGPDMKKVKKSVRSNPAPSGPLNPASGNNTNKVVLYDKDGHELIKITHLHDVDAYGKAETDKSIIMDAFFDWLIDNGY